MFHKLEPGLLVGQKISYELTVKDTYVRRRTCSYVVVCMYNVQCTVVLFSNV